MCADNCWLPTLYLARWNLSHNESSPHRQTDRQRCMHEIRLNCIRVSRVCLSVMSMRDLMEANISGRRTHTAGHTHPHPCPPLPSPSLYALTSMPGAVIVEQALNSQASHEQAAVPTLPHTHRYTHVHYTHTHTHTERERERHTERCSVWGSQLTSVPSGLGTVAVLSGAENLKRTPPRRQLMDS